MKTLTSLFFFFIAASALTAADPKCERLELYNFSNLKSSFESDLVSNVWRSGITGVQSMLYFQKDGSVLAVAQSTGVAQSFTWSVSAAMGCATLMLQQGTTQRTFCIAPTCNGISATAKGKNSPLYVHESKLLSENEVAFLKAQLTGNWKHHSRPKKTGQTGFALQLNTDHTYALFNGPDAVHSSQEGTWNLSHDGRFLVLFVPVLKETEVMYVPETIRIRSVDFEDLVVETDALPRALNGYQAMDVLYLGKSGR